MRIKTRILAIIVLILGLIAISNSIKAQSVIQNGKTFIEKVDTTKSKETKTGYVFQDKKGNVYPIYLSSTGKAFIIRISQRTGKQYRQYLPEVTAKLGTDKTKGGNNATDKSKN